MYSGLIDYLAFTYSFVCKGKRKVEQEGLNMVADAAHMIATNARKVIGKENTVDSVDDRETLVLAMRMDEHITEIVRLPD